MILSVISGRYVSPPSGIGLASVDDRVDAGVQRVEHGLGVGAVGGGVLAELVRLVADGGQLVDIEGRPQWE